MTINVLRGRRTRHTGPTHRAAVSLPIGDDQAPDVFVCPSCGRPLATGTTRCAGCGTLLLVGVPARRAGLFVVIGLAGGLVAGGLIAGFIATASRAVPPPALAAGTTPTALAAPGIGTTSVTGAGTGTVPVTTAVTGTGTSAPAIPTIPVAASSALRLSATVDDRLSAASDTLRGQLDAAAFDAASAAATIREIAADAAYGSDLVRRLDGWAAADEVRAQLRDLYAAVRATAREGLSASLTSDAAYRTAARQMLELLAGLPASRAAIDSLAAANGIVLPTPAPGVPGVP